MKTFSLALLLGLFLCIPAFADDAPAISAVQAATIAQEDLEMRGIQNQVYIAQIIYKKGGFGSEELWEVLWSKSFPAQTEGRNEWGLKITMDGNYKRAVR